MLTDDIEHTFSAGVNAGPLVDESFTLTIRDGKTGRVLRVDDLSEEEKQDLRNTLSSCGNCTNEWYQILARRFGKIPV